MDHYTPYSIPTQLITPPPSICGDYSSVTKLLDLLRKRKRGAPSFLKAWNVFTFSLQDFQELQRQLEVDKHLWGYVEDKVKLISLNISNLVPSNSLVG